MKIAVVGSRGFTDKVFINSILKYQFNHQRGDTLVSGGANGVDSIAEEVINDWKNLHVKTYDGKEEDFKIDTKIFLPNWNRYGKRAGFLRNELIIDEADKVIAFWDGKSKGTKHSIDLAIKAGKPVDIYVR